MVLYGKTCARPWQNSEKVCLNFCIWVLSHCIFVKGKDFFKDAGHYQLSSIYPLPIVEDSAERAKFAPSQCVS